MADQNVRTFKEGDIIFKEKDPGNEMFILLEGCVELKKKVEKGLILLKTVCTPNDFFGEMSLVDDMPRSATALAAAPTKLLVVNETAFENFIASNGQFALKIIKVLSERIRNSNREISDLIANDPRERFVFGMVDFAERNGEKIFNGGLKISITDMTSWINNHLGISIEDIGAHLYRLMKNKEIDYAATSATTKEHLILPEEFINRHNRRTG